MTILLESERLILRRFTMQDAEHLYALDNDPEVMRYINGGIPTPRAMIEQELLPRFLAAYEPPGYGFWAAIEKATGAFVGWFSLRPREGTAWLGYRLCRAAWGQGYATEGARALLDKAFAEWGVARVAATTYEENVASRRVMEKLGMRFHRAFRLAAEDLKQADSAHTEGSTLWDGDDVEYVLERAEWARRQ